MNINNFIVNPSTTILEAMKVINENTKGIVFICAIKRLIGVVTDGDIRRYILQKGDLQNNVLKIANKNAIWLELKNEKAAMQVMTQNSVSAVPILNDKKEIKKTEYTEQPLYEGGQMRIPFTCRRF